MMNFNDSVIALALKDVLRKVKSFYKSEEAYFPREMWFMITLFAIVLIIAYKMWFVILPILFYFHIAV